jgi:uncharacterized protein
MALKLFPKGREFYELFTRSAGQVMAAANALDELVNNFVDVPAKVARIKDIEHACDKITHECFERLNKTFITPLDREDIHALITSLDDVCDAIDATAIRLQLYRVDKPTPMLKDMAALLVRCTKTVHDAVVRLDEIKNPEQILAECVQINKLENEGDQLLRKAVGDLFDTEKDAISLIKWKEIYELLEQATDRCEDMANAIETVVLKNA